MRLVSGLRTTGERRSARRVSARQLRQLRLSPDCRQSGGDLSGQAKQAASSARNYAVSTIPVFRFGALLGSVVDVRGFSKMGVGQGECIQP
jgi:hypothetical protein